MQVVIKVTGLDNVQSRLTKLGTSLHDFTAALETLGKSLILFYSDTVFTSEGQALGSRWTPLTNKTEDYKRDRWPGRGILQRSGALQHGFYSEVSPDTLFVSNNVPYFSYHQLGTATGSGRGHNIPRRPMLGINSRVERMIKTVLQADIKAKIESTNV